MLWGFGGVPLISVTIKEFWEGLHKFMLTLKKILRALFPFISVKKIFESSVEFPFPLIALCSGVNPYCHHRHQEHAVGEWVLLNTCKLHLAAVRKLCQHFVEF